jgi:hypothetical protein
MTVEQRRVPTESPIRRDRNQRDVGLNFDMGERKKK